jgi:hypothetical protein
MIALKITSNELPDLPPNDWKEKTNDQTWEEFRFLYNEYLYINEQLIEAEEKYKELNEKYEKIKALYTSAELDIIKLKKVLKKDKKFVRTGFNVGVGFLLDLQRNSYININNNLNIFIYDKVLISPYVTTQAYPEFKIGGGLSIGVIF